MRNILLGIFLSIILATPTIASVEKQKDAQRYFSAGKEKLKQYDYQGAIEYFTKFTYLAPDNPSGYIYRAMSYSYQGNKDAALVDWSNCIRCAKKSDKLSLARCHEQRASIFFNREQYAKALYDYKKSKEIWTRIGNKTNANKLSKKILACKSSMPEELSAKDYLDKAKKSFQSKDFKTASNHLSKAIELEPKNPYLYKLRASAKINMNLKQAALEDAIIARDLYSKKGNLDKTKQMEYLIKSLH